MKTIQFKVPRLSLYSLLVLLTFGLTACDSNVTGPELERENDIVNVAATPDFTTLTAAIDAAGLTETLRSDGPFTVFAPTNEAFAKLPEPALRTLLDPRHRNELADILTFHVVPERVYSSEIVQLTAAKTTTNNQLNFTLEDGKVYVNDARVIKTDIEATNGIVHVVDTVLLPEWFDEWLSRSEVPADPLAY